MRCKPIFVAFVLIAFSATSARADFITEFSGFQTIQEVGVSGLASTYFGDVKAGLSISGDYVSHNLAEFGPERISYPSGIGAVPSPGGSIGLNFDQGALGFMVEGNDLVFKLATALDPTQGYYHSGWKTWYGQGDLFLSVSDGDNVNQYALLNVWARDEQDKTRNINNNYYNKGENFHVKGGAGNNSLEGHLVALQDDSDVLITGGTGAYTQSNAPNGLDRRVYAAGGLDLGDAGLTLGSFTDDGRQWYTETWRISMSSVSTAGTFDIGLHTAASCGNDQIGGRFSVVTPEPTSIFLLFCGALAWRHWREL